MEKNRWSGFRRVMCEMPLDAGGGVWLKERGYAGGGVRTEERGHAGGMGCGGGAAAAAGVAAVTAQAEGGAL